MSSFVRQSSKQSSSMPFGCVDYLVLGYRWSQHGTWEHFFGRSEIQNGWQDTANIQWFGWRCGMLWWHTTDSGYWDLLNKIMTLDTSQLQIQCWIQYFMEALFLGSSMDCMFLFVFVFFVFLGPLSYIVTSFLELLAPKGGPVLFVLKNHQKHRWGRSLRTRRGRLGTRRIQRWELRSSAGDLYLSLYRTRWSMLKWDIRNTHLYTIIYKMLWISIHLPLWSLSLSLCLLKYNFV